MPAKTAAPPPPLDRRQALVAAAFHQIAERGFEGLRTREVAAEVGVNVATLHYYFPTKEALIRGVLQHAMERFRTTIPSTGSPADQLRGNLAGVRRLARDEPELFVVMGELALRSTRDPVIRDLYAATTEAWRATTRSLLARAAADGSLAAGRDVDAQASLFIAAISGACMIPPFVPARLTEVVAELERSVGLR